MERHGSELSWPVEASGGGRTRLQEVERDELIALEASGSVLLCVAPGLAGEGTRAVAEYQRGADPLRRPRSGR